jgi:glycosyltransferase involved in cell wall biosynthesis
MRILFLSSGPLVPSSRFRIAPYTRHFRAEGHTVVVAHSFPQKYDYFPWMGFRPSQLLKRTVRWWHWLRSRLQRFDVVFIDREIFDSASMEMEIRFRESCGKLVLDLDDAVFLRYPEKFSALLPMADLVVCGNRFLMEKVRPLNPSLCHIPTCVEMARYTCRDYDPIVDSDSLVIGWMGTSGNLPYLSVAAEALRVLATRKKFELRLVVPDTAALTRMDLKGVRVVSGPWTAEREIADLKRFDIGLMPLFPDQEWDLYKCGLKMIQYLAVGVPAIASPVGVNAEILENNQNGFSATTAEEWLEALEALAGSPSLRRTMGLRGRQTVLERYSIEACYPVLRDALRSVVER